MTDRKLMTFRIVSDIRPIENADMIELAIVDGWQLVIKKGEFKIGDRAVLHRYVFTMLDVLSFV